MNTTDKQAAHPSFVIAAEFLPRLQERVAKLNRKATKLGVAPVVMEASDPFTETYNEGEEDEYIIQYVSVCFSAEYVGVGNYELLATVDLVGGSDGPRVVVTQQGVQSNPDWHWVKDYCDHCKTANRGRKHILIIRHTDDDGAQTELRVGRSCFKDFTGHSVAALTFFWDVVADAREDYSTYGRAERTYSVRRVLELSVAAVRTYGWVPARKREEGMEPTADLVRRYLSTLDSFKRDIILEVTQEDAALAAETHKWMRTLQMTDESEFIRNLAVVTSEDVVRGKTLGLVVAAHPVRMNIAARELERKMQPTPTNVPVSDQRIRVTGTVTKVDTYYSDWGASEKMTVLDDRGFRVWGSTTHYEMKRGDRVTFIARVTPSADDATFGFFKRPTKAELLNDTTN